MKQEHRTTLRQETVDAWQTAVLAAQTEAHACSTAGDFLWSDGCPKRARQVAEGAAVVGNIHDVARVPDGLVHDWVGNIRVPATTVAATVAMLQDYENHKSVYRPEIIDSRLLSRNGDHFEIYLRMFKKKVISVVLDTWHSVEYGRISPVRSYCSSQTTRICEIDHPGAPAELARLPDTGHGFLWRMYTHWKFEERDGAVWIECRAISLTRDIPSALAWIIGPMIQKLPAESLKSTLEATRRALAAS